MPVLNERWLKIALVGVMITPRHKISKGVRRVYVVQQNNSN